MPKVRRARSLSDSPARAMARSTTIGPMRTESKGRCTQACASVMRPISTAFASSRQRAPMWRQAVMCSATDAAVSTAATLHSAAVARRDATTSSAAIEAWSAQG